MDGLVEDANVGEGWPAQDAHAVGDVGRVAHAEKNARHSGRAGQHPQRFPGEAFRSAGEWQVGVDRRDAVTHRP